MREQRILWCTLDGAAEAAAFVEAGMRELLAVLQGEPLRLQVCGDAMDDGDGSLVDAVAHLEHGNPDGCVKAIRAVQQGGGPGRSGVLVYCRPDHPAAVAARKRLPHAAWGITLSGVLSLAYAGENKHLLWHEALHLLGAQDHYDLNTFRTTCELASCVMQYAPSEAVIAGRRFICERTEEIVRRRCGRGNAEGSE